VQVSAEAKLVLTMPSVADILSQKKKEYAKVAITLTVSQGQALQVFEKIFLFFLNASLKKKSIFPKNLDSRRCIAVGFAYPFFLLSFLFILFRGKNNCCFLCL